jgi:membrane-associated progesterone receptor component
MAPFNYIDSLSLSHCCALTELKEYTGINTKNPILICAKGDLFDVTRSAQFYGPGAGYHCLTGRDASVMLAKMITDPNDPVLVGATVQGLSAAEKETLDQWYTNTFTAKYEKVGKLVPSKLSEAKKDK